MLKANINVFAKFQKLRHKYQRYEHDAHKLGDLVLLNQAKRLGNILTDLVRSLECVYGASEARDVFNAMANRKDQKKRVRARLRGMAEAFGVDALRFVTLTLDDNHINLKKTTVKRYAKAYLKQHSLEYVANLDYGTESERLHIHSVMAFPSKPDYKALSASWKLGSVNIERYRKGGASPSRISTYLNKLSNHSTKWSASELIFSRIVRDDNGMVDLDLIDELPF